MRLKSLIAGLLCLIAASPVLAGSMTLLGTGKPAGGGAFIDPTSLGANCLAWYDGSDNAAFTFSSGSNVATWLDKSGNSRTLTATGVTAVLTSSVQNSKSAVRVGSTGETLLTAAASLGGTPDVYAVVQVSVQSGYSVIVEDINFLFLANTSTNTRYGTYSAGDVNATTALSSATTYLLEMVGGASGTFYKKGVADGTFPGTSGGGAGFKLRLAGSGTTQTLNGFLMEVVLTNNLGTTDRQNLENYLIAKWAVP